MALPVELPVLLRRPTTNRRLRCLELMKVKIHRQRVTPARSSARFGCVIRLKFNVSLLSLPRPTKKSKSITTPMRPTPMRPSRTMSKKTRTTRREKMAMKTKTTLVRNPTTRARRKKKNHVAMNVGHLKKRTKIAE